MAVVADTKDSTSTPSRASSPGTRVTVSGHLLLKKEREREKERVCSRMLVLDFDQDFDCFILFEPIFRASR